MIDALDKHDYDIILQKYPLSFDLNNVDGLSFTVT